MGGPAGHHGGDLVCLAHPFSNALRLAGCPAPFRVGLYCRNPVVNILVTVGAFPICIRMITEQHHRGAVLHRVIHV